MFESVWVCVYVLGAFVAVVVWTRSKSNICGGSCVEAKLLE